MMNVLRNQPQPQQKQLQQQQSDDLVIYQDRGLAKNARLVHGVNPVLLVEKITREKIQDSVYWKLNCFGINALTFIEKSADLKLIAGNSIANLPSHFQCLMLKLLQIQPSDEIVLQFLNQKFFKYLTCVALFYIRLTFPPLQVYSLLEPFYNDYRKIRFRSNAYSPVVQYHIDEFVDDLLSKERVCDLILPRLTSRIVLEDNEELEPRQSLLQDSDDENSSDDEVDEEEQ